jgi:hypothetical protein
MNMPANVLLRMISIAFCMITPLTSSALAQDYSPDAVSMFRELKQQPNDLARYAYLLREIPKLPVSDQQLAMQMFASVENELGLYNEAVHDVPLKS